MGGGGYSYPEPRNVNPVPSRPGPASTPMSSEMKSLVDNKKEVYALFVQGPDRQASEQGRWDPKRVHT